MRIISISFRAEEFLCTCNRYKYFFSAVFSDCPNCTQTRLGWY